MKHVIVNPTTEDGYDQWLALLYSGYRIIDILPDGREVLELIGEENT